MNPVTRHVFPAPLFLLAWAAAAFLAAPLSGQTLVHAYDFKNSLADSIGNVPLGNNGATLDDGSLAFGVNQGPSLALESALADGYSIGLAFSFDAITGYDKIVDFGLRGPDSGFYSYNGQLNLYPTATGMTSFQAGETIRVIITRDASTQLFVAYLDGVKQFEFTDTAQDGVASLNGGRAIFNFFQDDAATGTREASAGVYMN